MDSLTHIALGACIGELFEEKELGKRAMLWGAISQSAPDIDFLSALWLDPAREVLAHRGFTHSILFGLFITLLMALAAERFHRPHNVSLKNWIIFLGTEVFLHIFIDAFNGYGVGWFVPFYNARISFNTLFVIDPAFSVWPGIACLILLKLKSTDKRRIPWVLFGLGLPAFYLLISLAIKFSINGKIKEAARRQDISYSRYFTTPTPLNNLLWFSVLEEKDGYFVSHVSFFDRSDSVHFYYFPRNENLLKPVLDHEDVHYLKRFSQGYYTVENWGDTLVFNDLRFGQMIGWRDPNAHFVFHYFLLHPNDNELVVQRGRFANWDKPAVASLWNRMWGN